MLLTNTVLVVEPDLDIRDMLLALLSEEGYHVRGVADGRSGLAALAHGPALALFDMALPDMSSVDLFGELRAMGPAGGRVILMSTMPLRAQAAPPPEMLAYLAKPFDIDTLLALVAYHIASPSQKPERVRARETASSSDAPRSHVPESNAL